MNTNPRLTLLADSRLQIHAPAKLNLGLRVFPARSDGFHDIETWMLPISWHDTLTFIPASGALELQITGRSEGVPTELDKNLVGKAAVKLAAAAGIPPTGTIQLHKVVPPGGGLGGGSSDAAAVLVALNHAWNLNFPEQHLLDIAAQLGSDIPFFIPARPALCTGRGEIMSPLTPLHPLFAVLIIPPRGCPTKEVYQAFDAGHRHPPTGKTNWQQLAGATADQLNALLINDLAPPAFHIAPWLGKLHDLAQGIAEQPIHLTGSGSTLFGLTSSAVQANNLQSRLTSSLPPDNAVIPVRILRGPPAPGANTEKGT